MHLPSSVDLAAFSSKSEIKSDDATKNLEKAKPPGKKSGKTKVSSTEAAQEVSKLSFNQATMPMEDNK